MKKFGEVLLVILAVIVVGIIIVAFGPVQLHRMFGGYDKVDRNFYPQWISNEEYCYLRVENYYIPVNIWPTPIQMLDGLLRGHNASFYIYKVNINQPDKKELLKKISMRVYFDLWQVPKPNITGENFTFRRLDNGELVLIVRGRPKYIVYYLNTDGRILKKRGFRYDSEFLDWRDIVDISPDGEKLLLKKINDLYVKVLKTGKENLFYEDTLSQRGRSKWIGGNNVIEYIGREEESKIKYEIYLCSNEKEHAELVYTGECENYDEINFLVLDAAISPSGDMLVLSKIGIFEKQDGNWQIIKDLQGMEFNFFYPNWSPDGKYLMGITDGDALKLIKYEDLLKD